MKQKTNIPEFNFSGDQLAEAGLSVAVENADRKEPGWSERVWELFKEWLSERPAGHRFLIEDFRFHLELKGLIEQPPSLRAYGILSVRGQKAGLIQSAGTVKVKNPKAHSANANVWFKK